MQKHFFIRQILVMYLILFLRSSIFSQELIHEGFDSGLVAPAGWDIKAGGVYTSVSGSGSAPPSIKLSASGDYIETCSFSNATECSFLIKGYSVDSLSMLAVYFNSGDEWIILDSIKPLPKTKKILVLPLPADAQKLKFVYNKSKGNLAFDDLIVKNTNYNADTLPPVFIKNSPKLTAFSDTSAMFSISISKPGLVYYIITSKGCPVPGNNDFFNFNNYNSACIVDTGIFKLKYNTDTTIIIKNLLMGTDYVGYWLTSSYNKSVAPKDANITNEFSLAGAAYDLFFSEIIRGSGNNKAIEICNPSKDTVMLKNYRVAISTNGGGWKTGYYNFPNNASIAPHDVYVILKPNADSNLVNFKIADVLTNVSVIGFTGNDARGLQKLDKLSNTWQFTDIFGYPDSSANFNVAGIAGAAANHTLLRKPFIKHGNTDWALSAGTNADNSEWIVKDLNDFSNLGKHQMQFKLEQIFDTVYFDNQEAPVIIDSINNKLTFILHSETDLSSMKLHYKLPEGIIAEPDSSGTFNCTMPVKLTLSTTDKIYSTDWTITALVDAAPEITGIRYDNTDTGKLIVTFSEPIITDNPLSGNSKPFIKLFEYGNASNALNFELISDSSGKVLKIIPENGFKSGLKYTLLIDSVYDYFNNPMPAYEWTFDASVQSSCNSFNVPSEIIYWPNPASEIVNINLPSGFDKNNLFVKLVSMKGEIFYPRVLKKAPQLSLSLSSAGDGIYVLYLQSGGKQASLLVIHNNK